MPTLDIDTLPPGLRKPIHLLSSDELEEILKGIRERRLRAYKEYEQAKLVEAQHRNNKLAERLNKQIGMLKKEIEAADKWLEKCEKRVANVMAMRVEMAGLDEFIVTRRATLGDNGIVITEQEDSD